MTDSNKKTLVFGASLKPERASNQAILLLNGLDIPVIAIGGRDGMVNNTPIYKAYQNVIEVHTISLYLGAPRQEEHIEYLLSLNPKRIIFNPGAENFSFYQKAKALGIEVLNACSLVMLKTRQY